MAGELIRREALERIIQRAAELQAGEHDIGEGLTRADVLALGRDVGIPARYLQQALIEEEARGTGDTVTGPLAWLAGPRTLVAARVVPAERPAIERALSDWLERGELLQVKRRYPDYTTWEPKAGAFASIQRALGAGGKSFALTRARQVAASVTPLETGLCHVRLQADVTNLRRRRLAGASTLTLFGALASGLAPALGVLFPWAFLPLALSVLLAVAFARGQEREGERVHVALEQLLDRLEHGERRPDVPRGDVGATLLGRVAIELRGWIKSP